MLDAEAVGRLMDRGTIEVAPLAFMRGRTLNDSFIILDEAQNTTPEQMKMFLTRLGFGSRMVITGDVTQIDLPEGRGRSGLLAVRDILEGVEGLAFVDLDSARRRAPPHRAGHRQRVRTSAIRDSTSRRPGSTAPTSRPTSRSSLMRWVRLAEHVLRGERGARRRRDGSGVRRRRPRSPT